MLRVLLRGGGGGGAAEVEEEEEEDAFGSCFCVEDNEGLDEEEEDNEGLDEGVGLGASASSPFLLDLCS